MPHFILFFLSLPPPLTGRKVWPTVWSSPFLPWYRKLEINLLYFGIRKFSTHIVSLGFFCIVVPLSMFTPEVSIPVSNRGSGGLRGCKR